MVYRLDDDLGDCDTLNFRGWRTFLGLRGVEIQSRNKHTILSVLRLLWVRRLLHSHVPCGMCNPPTFGGRGTTSNAGSHSDLSVTQ